MRTAKAVELLNALSHESRLRIFRMLVVAGPQGLSVGSIRARAKIPAATLTAQLNLLRAADLVLDEREGRTIRVRANFERMTALVEFLTENCCRDPAMCAPTVCAPATPSKPQSKPTSKRSSR